MNYKYFLALLFIFSACKKEQAPTGIRSLSASVIIPVSPILSGALAPHNTTADTIRLTSNVTWSLDGLVYVEAPDVLIIDPGTVINALPPMTAGSPGGGLIITRGAQIFAEGTCTSPIIFTCTGNWLGVVIIGNAPSNHSGRVHVDGLPAGLPFDDTYGGNIGTDPTDNSGRLTYTRIEYGGFQLAFDKSTGSLTLAGVGFGSTIDRVESFKANTDAFEIFGGTVNPSHLVAVDALDDMFDTNFGYRGSISYALGLADPLRADASQSNGLESDNYFVNNTLDDVTPITRPQYNFVTIVGQPSAATAAATGLPPSGTGSYGRAVHFRRDTEFDIANSIFMGYTYGVTLDDTQTAFPLGSNTYQKYTSSTSTLTNVHTQAYSVTYAHQTGVTYSLYSVAASDRSYPTITANLALSPFNRTAIGNFAPIQFPTNPARAAGAFPNGDVTWASCGFVRLQ